MRNPIQLIVQFVEGSVGAYTVPDGGSWRYANEPGEMPRLIICPEGAGVPRTEIPLANVAHVEVQRLPEFEDIGVTVINLGELLDQLPSPEEAQQQMDQEPKTVPDLMQALEDSITAAKKDRRPDA